MRANRELRKARERAQVAAIKRHCTGDPSTCRESYHVPSQPDIPLCGILGGECERERARRR